MSHIDVNQFTGLAPLEITPAEAGTGIVRLDRDGLFEDYLRRASTPPVESGNNDTNVWEDGSGQEQTSQAESAGPIEEKSFCAEQAGYSHQEESPSQTKNSEVNKNSVAKAVTSELEEQNRESKPEPAKGKNTTSQTEKGKKNKKKDEHDEPELSVTNDNRTDRPDAIMNPEASKAKGSAQLTDKATVTETTINESPDRPIVTSECAEPIADPNSVITDVLSVSVADGAEQSVPVPIKGKATKNNVISDGDKLHTLPVENQESKDISATEEGEHFAVRTKGYISANHRRVQPRSLKQNGKEPAATHVSESVGSLSAFQEAAGSAQAINTAVLKAEVGTQMWQTKPLEVKDVLKGSGASQDGNADVPGSALPRLGHQASKTAGATGTLKGDEIGSQADRVRFVQRVERAFAAMGDRGGSVRLKLSPPELGSLRVEITVRKGMMRARVEAETKAAKNLLLENLPALRDRLAQQNIKIQQFDVDLRDPSLGGTPQEAGRQNETQTRDGEYRVKRSRARESSGTPTQSSITQLKDHSGQLNVIV